MLDKDSNIEDFSPLWFYRSSFTNHWTLPYIPKRWNSLSTRINDESYELGSLTYSLSSYLGSIVANEAVKAIGVGIPYEYGFLYGKRSDETSELILGESRSKKASNCHCWCWCNRM